MDEITRRLQREAERIAAKQQVPEFYTRFKAPMALARKLYFSHPSVTLILETIRPMLQEDLGHGIYHCSRVSIDSAALILIEMELTPASRSRKERLMVLGLIAGLLHDICRGMAKHAEAGAIEAARLLKDFPLKDEEAQGICSAIANHEAFVAPSPCKSPWAQLLSDCLYDADKFRWGRDTFTHTLWHMVYRQGLTPQEIIDRFPWGLEGILKIQETFRTTTGRQYGPEIIESGAETGKEIYRYLLNHF